MYCPYCGNQISAGANFCPNCGAPVSGNSTSAREYQLILVKKGKADDSILRNLLMDTLSYTYDEASGLIRNVPVQIAQDLQETEAAYLAQMFTEYGAEVTVLDENQVYVDLSKKVNSSVFDTDGSLLKNVAAVIGALTIANKMTHSRKIRKPSLLERIFRPLFAPKQRKVYVPVHRPNQKHPQNRPQPGFNSHRTYRMYGNVPRGGMPGRRNGTFKKR